MMINIKFNLFFILTFILLLPIIVNGACPNKCSGHGKCQEDDVCACKQNWFGGDCSQRRCPYTRAWVDGNNPNDPHYFAECANKGSCDRETGMCNCDKGYGGSGCRRQTCPNDCSGHGTCEFIDDFSGNSLLSDWEKNKIMGCKCDPGYENHDCSSKICPKGDDPLTTTNELKYKQLIQIVGAVDTIYIIYSDPFGNEWTTEAFTFSCNGIQSQLLAIPNHALTGITVEEAKQMTLYEVTAGESSSTAISLENADNMACLITYPQKAGTTNVQRLQVKYDPADYNVQGMQPYESHGDTTVITSLTVNEVLLTGVTTPKYHELATCSNRGICDGSTGQCECFTGHKGLSCEIQEALF